MKPDTATLNAFIQGLCAIGSNIDEFTTTISGKMGSGQRVTDALLVLRAMRREQIEPDDYTYSILFAALGGYFINGHESLSCLFIMDPFPSIHSYMLADIHNLRLLHFAFVHSFLLP